jgi:hypothetical protein
MAWVISFTISSQGFHRGDRRERREKKIYISKYPNGSSFNNENEKLPEPK